MDFGCVFFGNVNIHPAVALAERRGFTHAWLYDSQMLTSDVYASLALCAVNTKKTVSIVYHVRRGVRTAAGCRTVGGGAEGGSRE